MRNKQVVIDCSVSISWFLPEENIKHSIEAVINYKSAIVPIIWELEILNTLLVAEKRNRITKLQRINILSLLSDLPITIEREYSKATFICITDLAEKFNLTSYDASYLELAIRHNIPIATMDKALLKACELAKVEIF